MHWGLAKVLAASCVADERRASEARARTVRGGDGSDGSLTGRILGTPDYTGPGHACGEMESLEDRVDVFGLGSLLCEVPAGRPPYDGSDFDNKCRRPRLEWADAHEEWRRHCWSL